MSKIKLSNGKEVYRGKKGKREVKVKLDLEKEVRKLIEEMEELKKKIK